jgi:hypothetical protein
LEVGIIADEEVRVLALREIGRGVDNIGLLVDADKIMKEVLKDLDAKALVECSCILH